MCALALTKIQWDLGTAYDLFVSLRALHDPDAFGVRASWAAGVRSRLPADHRQTLDLAIKQISPPLFFVHTLPAPRNAASVIDALKKMPPSRVLETLSFPFLRPPPRSKRPCSMSVRVTSGPLPKGRFWWIMPV